jgi:putative copper export protein
MDIHALLRLLHITCFAAWFGTVLSSLFLLKILENRLTGSEGESREFAALLKHYIRLETRVTDFVFTGCVITGILLAVFFHGWSLWVLVKSGLIMLQVILTMGYVIRSIRPVTYPCTRAEYRNWYRLFTISLCMFALILLITFFLL